MFLCQSGTINPVHMRTFLVLVVLLAVSCQNRDENQTTADASETMLNRESFQAEIDGKTTDLFSLRNGQGTEVDITNFGGRVVALRVPDRVGNLADIVQGFDSIEAYQNATETYFGATIGRYGNRIADGRFVLDGDTVILAKNNGDNHLHGGPKGFHNVVWDANQLDDQTLELHYLSPDGDEGYPGALDVTVVYHLTDDNDLEITYEATTDRTTVVNLTHHSFFNLNGENAGPINDHVLMINADMYTPVDSSLIPTGENLPVAGTPFDFRQPKEIGESVNDTHEQIKHGMGYDHNFVLNRSESDTLSLAARIYSPASGRQMEVWTDEPGLQFYGGNFLAGADIGKGGVPYQYRTSFCLETQHFPDSPNQPSFPSTTLEPGEIYRSTCIYRFSVR